MAITMLEGGPQATAEKNTHNYVIPSQKFTTEIFLRFLRSRCACTDKFYVNGVECFDKLHFFLSLCLYSNTKYKKNQLVFPTGIVEVSSEMFKLQLLDYR